VSERLITHEDFGALAAEVLSKGFPFRFKAHGNSMRPFIYNGETIELTAVDPDQLLQARKRSFIVTPGGPGAENNQRAQVLNPGRRLLLAGWGGSA
jgi:hypothetical protein